MKRKRLLVLFALVILIALGALMLLRRGDPDPSGATPPPAAADAAKGVNPSLTVATVAPERSTLPVSLPANGNIVAWQEAVIGTEVNGLRLKEVRVNVGDTVKAGQVLAAFADETVRADLAQAQANLAEARASAADAVANAERAKSLQRTGALSEQQINQYLTSAETARARGAAAQAAVEVQQVRLRQTQVLAPDHGVISSRTATVGAVVGAGTELFRMIRQGRLEWRAEVTSSELGRIPPGTEARITAPSGAQLTGRVRTIGPTVDPQTRNALVYVDLPPGGTDAMPVKAGMFARGEFVLGQSQALTVPLEAVLLRDGFTYVFVLRERDGERGRVAQVKVETGRRLGDRLEITSGVDPQAQVVVRGAAFLTDGDLVRVNAADAPPPAQTGATGLPAAATPAVPAGTTPATPSVSPTR